MSKKDVDLSNITASFNFPKIQRLRGFNASYLIIEFNSLSSSTYNIENKAFNSLEELFDEVCSYYTYDLNENDYINMGDGEAYFRQELVYNKEKLKNYVLELTYNFKCIRSTSTNYDVDAIN